MKNKSAILFFLLNACALGTYAQLQFDKQEYVTRRENLMDNIPDGIAILRGAPLPPSSTQFFQSNNLMYFTGLEIPDLILVVDGVKRNSAIFLSISEKEARGEGIPVELVRLPGLYNGIEKVLPYDSLAGYLKSRLQTGLIVYTPFRSEELQCEVSAEKTRSLKESMTDNEWDGRLIRELQFVQKLLEKYPGTEVKDCWAMISDLRMYKSDAEVNMIREAGKIAAKAHIAFIEATTVRSREIDLANLFEYVCIKNGAQGLAYSTIVMSGENLPYGHYHRYNRTLLEGDFVVLDAGPTYQYYDADVSTSFPANGKFNPKQAELYAIANGIREVCIKSYKPGITFSQVGQNVRKYLVDQGLNPDEPRFKGYIKYGGYNHSIGMAVHDGMGTFAGPDEVLKKGFVFACDINMIYADINIGIRLEDTIVITADGCEVLSAGVPRTIKEVENAMNGYQKNAIYQRPVQVERSRDFDALHYDISLNVDMDQKRLSGVNKVTLKPLNNGFSSCVLDAEFLIVSGVNDRNGKPLTFKQENNQVLINFDRTYSHSDTIVFDVHYSLNQAILGLRFIDETPTNPKLVSSDCFPNKAHQWIPCSDYPSDKVTTDIRVTTDKRYKVLANGKLIGVSSSNQPTPNSHTWHWRQSLPHSTYLISLSIGDYAVIEDSLGSLPVNYWVYNWHVEDAKRSFAKTPHMISFYNKLYGYDYPWEKYDQVITSYMGGGAEATTATILGQGAVTDKNAEQDFSYERVIAHEIAHHWWGDLITLRSWEHTWMNESFATYSDYLYTRAEYGEDAGAYDLLGKKNQYLNEARNRYIRPIVFNRYDNPGDNFDSHTYPKGATVLHLLRYILGDDAFFRTLSAFLHKYEFEPVDTHDFSKTVKEVTGKNMDWFFEQYVFSPGHAIFEVTKNWDESRKVLKVKVVQKQDSSPGMPIYTMPVNLGFHYPYEHIVKEVWLKEKEETFEFPLNSEPLLVRFDEGNYLLKECVFKKSVEELLYQVENDDVIGRLAAVDELKEFGTNPTVIKAWADRVAKDSFWAVRQAALNNLGSFAVAENLDLIKQASGDENSKVRLSAVRILGNKMDKTLIRFFKQIFENDNSYLVKAEALKSIGRVGSKKDIPFLNQAASQKSHNNLVGKAAAEALAMIK